MPNTTFGIISNISENKSDTSLFVQKFNLGINYIESNNEEEIDMKNKFRIEKLTCPIKNTDAACNSYVDNGLNGPSIIRHNTHVDFKDKNLDSVRFVKINCLPAV